MGTTLLSNLALPIVRLKNNSTSFLSARMSARALRSTCNRSPSSQTVQSLERSTLSRDLTYYKNPFGKQTLAMDPESTDPAMYLPISAAFWPYLQRVGFFAPALRALASQTADQLAPPAKPPLHTLASLQAYNPLQAFVSNSISLVGPALGPFAASFIPPNDSGAAPWIDAARWLGWVLMRSQNLTSAFTSQYEYLTSIVPATGGAGSHKLPIFKAPSAHPTPASQINDLLGK